jgi:hypothetical protein
MNTKPFPPTRSRPTRRRSAKRGSVLILVVALLVLMALIGTAWISTTRVDRAASVQNVNNVQADLMIEAVVNIAKAGILADAGDGTLVRTGPGYASSDSAVSDSYLSSRLPVFVDETAPVWSTAAPTTPGGSAPYGEVPVYAAGRVVRTGGNSGRFYVCLKTHRADPGKPPTSGAPYWAPLANYNINAGNGDDNPVVWPATTAILPPDTQFEDITGAYGPYTQRTGVQITTVTLNGRDYPAFWVNIPGIGRVQVPAADTDGDGLADASYFKLPVGTVNGLEYYAAIRVVDNNSAVNPSVAYAADQGAVAHFPSSLSIGNLLIGKNNEPQEQARHLEWARADDNSANDFQTNPVPYGSYGPINDQPTGTRGRKDFTYAALGAGGMEQLYWFTAGRRLQNPGYWSDGSGPAIRMKALPATDAAALAYRGGTLMNPDAMNAAPSYAASSLIEQLLPQTLYLSADNHPAAGTNPAYRFNVTRQSAYPAGNALAWQELFRRNFDFGTYAGGQRFAPPTEDVNDLSTYLNRRVLMALTNPVSGAVPSKLVGRTGAQVTPTPGPWMSSPGFGYDLGDCVTHNGIVFVCLGPVPKDPPTQPGAASTTGAFDRPDKVISWEARPFEKLPTKASANAGSFGQLLLAFWQTMVEPASLKRPPTSAEPNPPQVQTPFKDAYRALLTSAAAELDSPFYGNRFVAGLPNMPTPAFPPYASPGGNGQPDQHPLRMFKNPIRAQPPSIGPSAFKFNQSTPRLMTDHTMRLRAALAAVNAMDMRDSDDDVTVREINIGLNLDRGTDVIDEADDLNAIGRVRVYGHERQPFLTEVYANNDNVTTGPAGAAANPMGYVAVELHNPYPFAIDIRNCKLATIDRTPGNVRVLTVADSAMPAMGGVPLQNLAPLLLYARSNLDQSGGQTLPWVIPANGFLVLENYDANGPAPTLAGTDPKIVPPTPPGTVTVAPPANYRPAATLLPPTGPIPTAGAAGLVAAHNYAYVPNLHTVLDKEVVLVRPLFAQAATSEILGAATAALRYTDSVVAPPGTPAVDMAPLDSFDFTGLANPDPVVVANQNIRGKASVRFPTATQASAWHYARAYQPTTAPDSTRAWRFVYPGRYDGHQTVNIIGQPRPRQQGTQEATWDPGAGGQPGTQPGTFDPWNPLAPAPVIPIPGISLADVPVAALNSTYFPYEYAIQLINTQAVLGNAAQALLALNGGAVGPNPVRGATGNAYPFGGYARNVDILQVPYIGGYRVKLTPYPLVNKAPPLLSGITTQVVASAGVLPYHQVLELNSITMDSVMAEDTDPNNHYNRPMAGPTDTTYALKPPEQIGRFTPSILDLESGAAGVVDKDSSFTAATPTRPPNPQPGTMDDSERREGGGTWAGYEIVIVDGPGKGQVRPVIGFSGGTFTVYPDWEVQLKALQSRYVLRRGSGWSYIDTTSAPAVLRTTGNKGWASDLLDYITVDCPQNDYLPAADPATYARFGAAMMPQAVSNVDPNQAPSISYGRVTGGGSNNVDGTDNLIEQNGFYNGGWIEMMSGPAAGQVRRVVGYAGGTRAITVDNAFSPSAASGDLFRIFGKNSEDGVGTQGLVNINTAPWEVLALLPFDDSGTAAALALNKTLAQAIVLYRDGDPSAGVAPGGPFRSVFDLYKVPLFYQYQEGLISTGADPGNKQGDFTPEGVTLNDNVRFDFEEQYLVLNRISNMITTRSDSFTVYVMVQGWRGAGDPTRSPELVVQRRRAFIADRTGVSPADKDVAVQYLYND